MDHGERRVVVFDLDGTLADCRHRQHLVMGEVKQWDEFFDRMMEDGLHEDIAELYWAFASQRRFEVMVFTGRPERYRTPTQKWLLNKVRMMPSVLSMRKDGDHRPDDLVKTEMAVRHLTGRRVLFIVDDRKSVVEMWRDLGYRCLQVDEGNF